MINKLSLAALLLLVANAGHAQSDRAASQPCWRGNPAPNCTSFFITEFGYQQLVTTLQSHQAATTTTGQPPSSERGVRNRVAWTVGPMFNTAAGRAVGVTATVGPLFPGSYAALEARRRWWLRDESALDLSGGIVRTASEYSTSSELRTDYGLTGGLYLVSSDIVNLSAHADMLLTGGKPRLSLSIGAGFGSYMTAAVTPIALLVVLVKNAYAQEGT